MLTRLDSNKITSNESLIIHVQDLINNQSIIIIIIQFLVDSHPNTVDNSFLSYMYIPDFSKIMNLSMREN